MYFQRTTDGRTAVYKQLLDDHRKITDKYKATEKDLAFTKSECLADRNTFFSEVDISVVD